VSVDRYGENRGVFEITSGPGEVNAWSEVRLPFQPKGEMLEFRQRLGAAIRAMPPAGAGHLAATYTAADPDTLIDTENILFYNVGLGCFAAHTRGGLAFERVFAAPPVPPAPASWIPRHHHRYRVTPPPADFEHWRRVHIAARWRDVPLGPGPLAHPERVWAALAHVDTPAEPDGPVRYYAIRIRLEGVEVAVANVVKPLIDGVVSSLHCFAGEIPGLVVERLSKATTTDPTDVRRRLTDQRRAVLGARPNLIRLTKNGIAFNPRDEDCVACVIEVAGSKQPRMTGTVFSVEPQKPAG
jgi:hypothetical protein